MDHCRASPAAVAPIMATTLATTIPTTMTMTIHAG
jgi:hypothetical protein